MSAKTLASEAQRALEAMALEALAPPAKPPRCYVCDKPQGVSPGVLVCASCALQICRTHRIGDRA